MQIFHFKHIIACIHTYIHTSKHTYIHYNVQYPKQKRKDLKLVERTGVKWKAHFFLNLCITLWYIRVESSFRNIWRRIHSCSKGNQGLCFGYWTLWCHWHHGVDNETFFLSYYNNSLFSKYNFYSSRIENMTLLHIFFVKSFIALVKVRQLCFEKWTHWSTWKSLWRNRLARSTVNRKVGGSSPPRDEVIFFYFSAFFQNLVVFLPI